MFEFSLSCPQPEQGDGTAPEEDHSPGPCPGGEDLLGEPERDVAMAVGEGFFQSLVRHLVLASGADCAFVGEFVDEAYGSSSSRMASVAFFGEGSPGESPDMGPDGTARADVIRASYCCFPEGNREHFPLDTLARELGVESYVSVPLVGSDGSVLGPMAIFGNRPLFDFPQAKSLLETFATRAASEMERRRAERRLRDQLHLHQTLIDAIPNPIFYKGTDGRYLGCNTAFEAFIGLPREEVRGRSVFEVAPPDLAEIYFRADQDLMRKKGVQNYESSVVYSDGTRHDVIFNKATFERADGCLGGMVGTILDITEHKRAEEKIRRLAYYDMVTGLPNRAYFQEELEKTLFGDGARGGALVYLDVDRFKALCDILGHTGGERILRVVADRLSKWVAGKGVALNLGLDQFLLVLPDLVREQDVVGAVREVMLNLAPPIVLDNHEVVVTASAGIALLPQHGRDGHSLLNNSHTAVCHAKQRGRSAHCFYSPEMRRQGEEILRLEHHLRRALDKDEFLLHYQPQIDLGSGEMVGVEALLRWEHPRWGRIPPSRFIPLAEENGHIVAIGEWVLKTACAQNLRWRKAGLPPLRMGVNLSGLQLKRSDFVGGVERVLEETGLEGEWLDLELTETSAMENTEENIETLKGLKRLGCRLSIDDFGTGYSSLSYLKRFPVDSLKIDRSFVHQVTTDADDAAIAGAIISMARSLQLDVVAEGVETPEQRDFLLTRGCSRMQGYYFGRPMAADDLEYRFRKTGWKVPLADS